MNYYKPWTVGKISKETRLKEVNFLVELLQMGMLWCAETLFILV